MIWNKIFSFVVGAALRVIGYGLSIFPGVSLPDDYLTAPLGEGTAYVAYIRASSPAVDIIMTHLAALVAVAFFVGTVALLVAVIRFILGFLSDFKIW